MTTTISDTGTGYTAPPAKHKAELTEVRRGTPMGELMRRYWHPVAASDKVKDLPLAVRALGEDLVLFRDKRGRPGLVHARCTHRGSSLLYGRIEEDGIRCCYHGWAFDVQGRCFDQPCEPHNGQHRDKVRQPWYPVEERYGLVWAYMGPPDKKPLLPRYDALENMREGDQLFVDDHNIGSGRYYEGDVPFNWLQHFENIHDFGHFLWLHYFHSGPQFGSRYGELDKLDFQPWERLANLQYRITERGITSDRTEVVPDGRTLRMVVETVLPAVRAVPNPFGKEGELDNLGFVLPVDDTNFRVFNVLRGPDDGFFALLRSMRGREEQQLAADPHHFQRFPSDWEAQGSQGPITLHSAEHLATSDRGIVMLRRLYQQQLAAIEAGKDPINVAFEAGREWVRFEAGQFILGQARQVPAPVHSTHPEGQVMSAAGLWNVVIKTPMGENKVVFDLAVEGTQVTGEVRGEKETNVIYDGKVDGNELTWGAKVSSPMKMSLEFKATVAGDSISGGAKSPFGTAPFSGSRA